MRVCGIAINKRRGVAYFLGVLLLFLGYGDLGAVSVLDQSFVTPPNVGLELSSQFSQAQTFAVGTFGELTRVDVYFFVSFRQAGNLTFSLVNTTGELPGTTVFASDNLSASEVTSTGFYSFDVSDADLLVDVGDVLALTLAGSSGSFFSIAYNTSGGYPGGRSYAINHSISSDWVPTSANADMLFRTFVDPTSSLITVGVPEPSALILIGSGFLLLAWKLRRSSKQADRQQVRPISSA